MFVSKINNIPTARTIGFGSLDHKTNSVGREKEIFNYPYDYENETCELQIFRVKVNDKYNLQIDESSAKTIQLTPEGVEIDVAELLNLDKNEGYVYKVIRRNKQTGEVTEVADTGVKVKIQDGEGVFRVNNYKDWDETVKGFGFHKDGFADPVSNYTHTYVSRSGTTPKIQGAAYQGIPDMMKPGMSYAGYYAKNTGELVFDKDYQKKMENTIRTASNMYGGGIAACESMIEYLHKNGYKKFSLTPLINGDNLTSHGYQAENNFAPAPARGNIENFGSFIRKMYTNGMTYVYDATFTSEGLDGNHFQHVLRHGTNSQYYRWFKMNGLKDSSLGLGIIPNNKEAVRHRIVNSPFIYHQDEKGIITKEINPEYNPNMEIYPQIFDGLTEATRAEINSQLDKKIEQYKNLKSGNELSVNTHDDTVSTYTMAIDDIKYYDRNVEILNEINKKTGKNIRMDSAEGTMILCNFPNFRFDKKTEGGFVTWDANTDLVKLNYHISGYDEKINQSIKDRAQRYHEQELFDRGTKEVQDMAIQAGRYITKKVNAIQNIYTAQTLGTVKTLDGINKLIESGKLPQEASVDSEKLNNILNGQYMLEPKGILDKDSVTIKALMDLPLEALEVNKNTSGVLGTSYFTNRATTDETIGMTRFELYKAKNPHLVQEYAKVYNRVDSLYTNELKDFAEAVMKKVDETSNEKIFDSNGDYTEYGEYVMELMGQDIAKYGFLKSLTGNRLETKLLPTGEITYNYNEGDKSLRQITSLKALDIRGSNPEEEALNLELKMERGLKRLSNDDISYVAESISKRIKGTDTNSFRLAEAMVKDSGLGVEFRLDAFKDVMDSDSARNRDTDYDDIWNDVIKFGKLFVQKGVKPYNPHAAITAEFTDVADMFRETYGPNSEPYAGGTDIGGKRFNGEPDAYAKLFNEMGITESALSLFFTDLLKIASPEFEAGRDISENHDSFKEKLDLLIQTRSIDYIRNLYTFMGTHDKPRLLHGLSVDMSLFDSPLVHDFPHGKADFYKYHAHRLDVIRVMSAAASQNEVPIELRLNADNNAYFGGISSRAVAQSKLLMDTLDEFVKDKNNEEDIKLIKSALVDLANGIYLENRTPDGLSRINIKELQTLESALNELLNLASSHGLSLSDSERKALIDEIISKVNETDLSDYLVHGDTSWSGPNEQIGAKNREYVRDILGTESQNAHMYVVQLARLMRDSYSKTKNPSLQAAINSAAKDFVNKYNKDTVNSATREEKKKVEYRDAMKMNGYAARDIKTAMSIAIKQAEFKSGKKIANKEELTEKTFKYATEPAVQKAATLMAFLKGLPGIPTMYAGDEMGMTGWEEKSKNIYLQNRNALPWSDLEKGSTISEYRKKVMEMMNGTLADRSKPEYSPLNIGTPYSLDVIADSKNRDEINLRIAEINKELSTLSEDSKTRQSLLDERRTLSKHLAKVAYMSHTANGDAAITIFDASGINHSNRFDYFKDLGIEDPAKRKKFFEDNNIESIDSENRYVPIRPKSELDYILLGSAVSLPVGMIFMTANSKDKNIYEVADINGKRAIVKKGGGKIILDGKTAKDGVMVLKKVIKKIGFRGKNNNQFYNEKFNIVSNPYKQKELTETGKNLSLVSK